MTTTTTTAMDQWAAAIAQLRAAQRDMERARYDAHGRASCDTEVRTVRARDFEYSQVGVVLDGRDEAWARGATPALFDEQVQEIRDTAADARALAARYEDMFTE